MLFKLFKKQSPYLAGLNYMQNSIQGLGLDLAQEVYFESVKSGVFMFRHVDFIIGCGDALSHYRRLRLLELNPNTAGE